MHAWWYKDANHYTYNVCHTCCYMWQRQHFLTWTWYWSNKRRNSLWMTSVDKQILQPWHLCAWPWEGAWQPPKVPCRRQKEGRLVVRDRQRLVFPAEYIMVTYRGWELEVTTRLQSYWRCTTTTGLYINSSAKSDFRGFSISGNYRPLTLIAVCFKFAQFPNLPLCKISF